MTNVIQILEPQRLRIQRGMMILGGTPNFYRPLCPKLPACHFHLKPPAQNGQPRSFRFTLTPAEKLNCFVPRSLNDDADLRAVRGTQFGGALLGDLHCLPQSEFCSTLWEAGHSGLGPFFNKILHCIL